MKKGTIFFHPIEGSGPLTISWSSRPKGDAVEAKKGFGVGFFSETGTLLCVIFDDVLSDIDHQSLEFESMTIDLSIKKGIATYTITQTGPSMPTRRRRKKKNHKA